MQAVPLALNSLGMWRPAVTVTVLSIVLVASIAVGVQAPTNPAAAPAPSERAGLNATVAQAMQVLRQGDYGAAIPLLEKLTAAAPGVPEYQADLCLAYYSTGHPRNAIPPCRKALKLNPSLAFARQVLAASLAASGECGEALPMLLKVYAEATDRRLRRRMGLDGVRCGMTAGQPFKAVQFLGWLSTDFPDDPDVLYLASHVFSDLSTRASQQLLHSAPGSYQAHQLNAEDLEIEDKVPEALEEYQKVLELQPGLPGIHYRMGRLLESQTGSDSMEKARREFQAELEIAPGDPGSEYELGEMDREARRWSDAIEHFSRAVAGQPDFVSALIGLGKSLVSANRPQEAVAPLEKAVKLAPGDPVAHYQLSFAYRRVGSEAEAQRELALYRELHEQQQRSRQAIRTAILGDMSSPQTAEPPQ